MFLKVRLGSLEAPPAGSRRAAGARRAWQRLARSGSWGPATKTRTHSLAEFAAVPQHASPEDRAHENGCMG